MDMPACVQFDFQNSQHIRAGGIELKRRKLTSQYLQLTSFPYLTFTTNSFLQITKDARNKIDIKCGLEFFPILIPYFRKIEINCIILRLIMPDIANTSLILFNVTSLIFIDFCLQYFGETLRINYQVLVLLFFHGKKNSF